MQYITNPKHQNTMMNQYGRAKIENKKNDVESRCTLQKIKELKYHAQQLDFLHKRTLSEKIQATKSITLINLCTQKLIIDFQKCYQVKREKLINKQKLKNLQEEQQKYRNKIIEEIKAKKQQSLIDLQKIKMQEVQNNQIRQQMNRRQTQRWKNLIQKKVMENYLYSKSMCSRKKEEQSYEKIKKLSTTLTRKCKINYADKIDNELKKIRVFQSLLEQAQNKKQAWPKGTPNGENSRSIFRTATKRKLSKPQSQLSS